VTVTWRLARTDHTQVIGVRASCHNGFVRFDQTNCGGFYAALPGGAPFF
jgi:hypothetical protein